MDRCHNCKWVYYYESRVVIKASSYPPSLLCDFLFSNFCHEITAKDLHRMRASQIFDFPASRTAGNISLFFINYSVSGILL
jgi:hypothetical protein